VFTGHSEHQVSIRQQLRRERHTAVPPEANASVAEHLHDIRVRTQAAAAQAGRGDDDIGSQRKQPAAKECFRRRGTADARSADQQHLGGWALMLRRW
jgi:hypothetical protein